jgi:hypothetical protein
MERRQERLLAEGCDLFAYMEFTKRRRQKLYPHHPEWKKHYGDLTYQEVLEKYFGVEPKNKQGKP